MDFILQVSTQNRASGNITEKWDLSLNRGEIFVVTDQMLLQMISPLTSTLPSVLQEDEEREPLRLFELKIKRGRLWLEALASTLQSQFYAQGEKKTLNLGDIEYVFELVTIEDTAKGLIAEPKVEPTTEPTFHLSLQNQELSGPVMETGILIHPEQNHEASLEHLTLHHLEQSPSSITLSSTAPSHTHAFKKHLVWFASAVVMTLITATAVLVWLNPKSFSFSYWLDQKKNTSKLLELGESDKGIPIEELELLASRLKKKK